MKNFSINPFFLTLFLLVILATSLQADANRPTIKDLRWQEDMLAQELDQAYTEFPRYRYTVGGYSLFFGSTTLYQGIKVLTADPNRSSREKSIAYLMLGIGTARLIDGAAQLFDKTQIEKDTERFNLMRKGKNSKNVQQRLQLAQQKLKKADEHFAFIRPIRSALILATGLSSLYLYGQDEKEYEILLYQGLIMAAISTVQFLVHSPAEKAWQRYQESIEKKPKLNLSYFVAPVQSGAMLGLNLSY